MSDFAPSIPGEFIQRALPVGIVLYTYDRIENAEPTLRAALEHLKYKDGFHVHIADDGSPAGYREALEAIASEYANVRLITVSNSERRGYGGSYNLASQAVNDYNFAVFSLEDDWLLIKDLEVLPLVKTLESTPVQCLRLGYLSYTNRMIGSLIETPIGQVLEFDPGESTEHHIFAGHARFETTEFRKRLGEWPEGLRAGETEWEVCKRFESRIGIGWPMELVKPSGDLFLHNGERSYNQLVPSGASNG